MDTLTQISCNYAGNNLTFQAEAGTTYYFQVANLYPWEQGGTMQFHLDVAPPPVAGIYFSPSDPTIFDNIQFYDQSYDPSGLGIQSFTWDFGDGTASTDANPIHRYAKEGDYTVQHTVTTTDGRTASTSQTVHVSTHDVTVTKVESPGSARTGQTQDVTVAVNNATSISETVRVDLYRSVIGGGFEWVNSLTLTVPPSKNNRSTQFLFRYTFTAVDAQIGKVIFRAVATIEGVRDAFPQDNERYSSLTIVKQKK
jgi:PKD repeat protein